MDRAQRLIIFNQIQIMEHLGLLSEEEARSQSDIVSSGYSSQYDELFGGVSDSEVEASVQEETLRVLDMFRALSNAQVKGWKPSDARAAAFGGFDGNNDPHYFFAGHLLDVRGLYPESAPNKNSHSSASLTIYRRMLEAWDKTAKPFELTPAEAESVIAA